MWIVIKRLIFFFQNDHRPMTRPTTPIFPTAFCDSRGRCAPIVLVLDDYKHREIVATVGPEVGQLNPSSLAANSLK